MKLTWHIFKKDAQRLWLEAGVTIGLLAWWAHLDRWRWGAVPNAMEGWLEVLLPFAWAYLVGLLVLQDSLVGERQFWVTTPVRWRSILAAKALFALVFILLPYFAAQAAILAFRGLHPASHIPHLLSKESLVFGVIVLPAAAIAAMVKDVVRFVLAAVLAAAAVIFAGTLHGNTPAFARTGMGPEWLALIPALAGAAAIVLVQYRARKTAIARVAGAAAAAAAFAIYAWLPLTASTAFDAALHPAHESVSFTLLPPQPVPKALRGYGLGRRGVAVALPFEIGGLPPGALVSFLPTALEIDAHGKRYEAIVSWPEARTASLVASLWDPDHYQYPRGNEGSGTYLLLNMDRSLWSRLGSTPVRLDGSLMASFRHAGSLAYLDVGQRAAVPGLGICASAVVPGQYMNGGMLKVSCESAGEVPYTTRVTLVGQDGRQWRQWLISAGMSVEYPQTTWLSPDNQRETYFHIAPDEVAMRYPAANEIVQDTLRTAKIEIRPEFSAGNAIVKFRVPNVRLASYELVPER